MAFKIQNASVDLVAATANVVALDLSAEPKIKVVNVQFPFTPSGDQGNERQEVVDAAKAVLQQALSEI